MRKSFREDLKNSFTVSAGWLFADLLLALAMLFLAANTFAIKPPPAPPKHVKKPIVKVTPKPTALPRLELQFHEFTINVDPNGLLNGSQGANASVEQQVKAQAVLRGRSVGLVIAYGGAPGDAQIGQAQAIAGKVYSVLKTLGRQGFAFSRSSYYNTLYDLGGSTNIVTIDVYLFAQ